MDPFTQRMRERARLRKGLAAGTDGQEEPIRSPLKDQNKSHTVKIITEEVTYSKPSKEDRSQAPKESENTVDSGPMEVPSSGNKRTDVRDRLQRLGALYSGSASSPIHRTEQTFSSEPVLMKPAPARSARLAALADSINQWEDQEQPSAAGSTTSASKVVEASCQEKEQVSVPTEKPAPACAVVKVTPKKSAWDAGLMQSLESQGFARSASKARLEFDFHGKESPSKPASTKEVWLQSPSQSKASPAKGSISPEKRPLVKGTNIVAKSALFESGSRSVDPTELSLAERAALFERNAGAPPPLPRVPFGTPLPKQTPVRSAVRTNAAVSPEKKAPQWTPQRIGNPVSVASSAATAAPSGARSVPKPPANNMVGAMQALLAAGGTQAPLTSHGLAEDSAAQRHRELDALRSRWGDRQQESGPPAPPPMPAPASQTSPTKTGPAMTSPTKLGHARPGPAQTSPTKKTSSTNISQIKTNAMKTNGSQPNAMNKSPSKVVLVPGSPSGQVGRPAVGRIRVSPPKPGRLYPCLSDIDATETEASDSEDQQPSWSMDSSSDASFGRSILAAVSANANVNPDVSAGAMDSSASSGAADDSFGRDVMAALEGDSDDSDEATPPKRARQENKTSGSAVSNSFHYHRGAQDVAPQEAPVENVVTPLLHTVSFYRRQQAKASPVKTPALAACPEAPPTEPTPGDSQAAVEAKVADLMEEIGRQMAVISQASRALTLCHATVEFSASQEAVEAERLLLLAGQRRLAALNEVQRLRVERSLKPLTEFGRAVEWGERGVVTLRDIALPLKRDFLRSMHSDPRTQHIVVLAKCQDQVLATRVLPAGPDLVFPGPLRLVELFSDFKIRLEVYTLQTRREVLTHDEKYHIVGKKDKSRMTPKKRAESRLLMPAVESPGGPNAVRQTGFTLAGFVVFSLNELKRTHFTLNTVSPCCPLEGQVHLKVSSQLSTSASHRGFLTSFHDVTGFGAWHRRWCVLNGAALSFWKYPDDEKTKVPLECVELTACESASAELVSRHVCARPNTILLETSRETLPGDTASLVMDLKHDRTVLRHLLSADTKEDRIEWCQQINKALRMLRAWTNACE